MCGIAGSLQRTGQVPDGVTERQLQILEHRGPDSWGIYARGPGSVGQTRLAVVDLVTGDPPIQSEDGAIGVVVNGEIYNFGDLRRSLTATGHHLATTGDTEVVVHLAEDHDPIDLAARLDGMFAFAILDTRRERLVLGRDRLGKKPLYYWRSGETFVFASELKALFAHPAVPRLLDKDAIAAYLTFGYVPTPRTMFEGVQSVPPGHVLVVDRDLQVTLTPYWRPPLRGVDFAPERCNLDEAATAIRSGLTQAVQRRLVADVPVGAFLSGGIDSSAVVGIMAGLSQAPVHTFTIGFEDDEGFDERPYAQTIARRFGTEHVEFVVRPNAVELVDELVWHYDQPFGDSSAVPTYLLSELTKKHVTVALCGDGGDELFAGYERFAAGAALQRWSAPLAVARPAAQVALQHLGQAALWRRAPKARRLVAGAALSMPDAYRSLVSFVPDGLVTELAGGLSDWGLTDYRDRWDATAGAEPLDRLLYLNLTTYLVDDLLPKVDRMSMAHALEVRAPFLDHHLLEMAARIPPSLKLRGRTLKRCLKAAVDDLVPAELLDRPKRGFGVPLARWFRVDLASMVDDTLLSPATRLSGHLDSDVVQRIVREHRSGTADHGHTLWTLLTLELFLRKNDW